MRVKINGTDTAVDPHILFTTLVLKMQTYGDIERCFEYELTPMPTALYTYGRLRKSDKLRREERQGMTPVARYIRRLRQVSSHSQCCRVHR